MTRSGADRWPGQSRRRHETALSSQATRSAAIPANPISKIRVGLIEPGNIQSEAPGRGITLLAVSLMRKQLLTRRSLARAREPLGLAKDEET